MTEVQFSTQQTNDIAAHVERALTPEQKAKLGSLGIDWKTVLASIIKALLASLLAGGGSTVPASTPK